MASTSGALWSCLKVLGLVNLTGFTITAVIKSEVLSDFMGTGAFALATGLLWRTAGNTSLRNAIVAGSVCLWSLRLSTYLAYRAFKVGDERLRKFLPQKGEPWFERLVAIHQ